MCLNLPRNIQEPGMHFDWKDIPGKIPQKLQRNPAANPAKNGH